MSDTLARATGAVYRRAWRQWIYASAVFTGALLGTYWGLPGTAAGVGGAILLNFLLMMHLSLKLTGATWSAIGLIHLRHFLCLAPILFPCWLVAYVSRACGAPDIVTLVLSAVAGGLPFFAMLFRFTRLLGDEGQWLKQLMQEQGGKRLRWLRKR